MLFTVALQKEMRSICLRMDIDGILWSFSDDEMKPIYHRATFNAFGYVQVFIIFISYTFDFMKF